MPFIPTRRHIFTGSSENNGDIYSPLFPVVRQLTKYQDRGHPADVGFKNDKKTSSVANSRSTYGFQSVSLSGHILIN